MERSKHNYFEKRVGGIVNKEIIEATKKLRDALLRSWEGFLKFDKMMRRPGIIFTKRQKRKIKKLVRRNKFWNAQKIILRKLSRCFGRNKK